MTLGLLDEICPVPLDLLGALYRADDETLEDLLNEIPERTRAQLAVYLYGRSHTHALGIRVAARCDGATLRRAAGLVGNALYEQSRQSHARPAEGGSRLSSRTRITLGGNKASAMRGTL